MQAVSGERGEWAEEEEVSEEQSGEDGEGVEEDGEEDVAKETEDECYDD